eukprot:TRINITY_DN33957_c0_g1_i1.p1 TRINITY_DN33957_c0_g1~~TRINITY_DN33957_c0_g1_i1.p1  ORF type:complete len:484 (+),score=100.82 TRINITY_DN33957_c0_g1_i1:54-1505(+)
MSRQMTEDGLSTSSELGFDPYADVPEHMAPPPLAVPQHQHLGGSMNGTHMPYASYSQAPAPVQQAYMSVVHPSGRVAWVPMQEGGSVANVKEQVARQLGLQETFQMARVTPLLDDTPVDRQCMPGDMIYILPNTKSENLQQMFPQDVQSSQPVTPLVSSMPSTPLSASGTSFTSMYHSTATASFPNSTMQQQSGTVAPWPLEEKIANAANSLTQVISQSRQCTELQQDLEQAVARGIDCSAVFQAAERHLPELILHPSGNYLVSKCFELCPSLIDTATAIIIGEVRMYALHKHGSYVVEAILVNKGSSVQSKMDLIGALLAPPNRVVVATHDSGNFVLQKAIENCPDELLWELQEAVQSVFHMSSHGPKMLKKLETRLAKSQQAPVPVNTSKSTLPLPASTAAYVNNVSKQKQAPAAPPQAQKEKSENGKETWVVNTEAKEVRTPVKRKEVCGRTQYMGSWADAEDGPLSPPPSMFTDSVPLP